MPVGRAWLVALWADGRQQNMLRLLFPCPLSPCNQISHSGPEATVWNCLKLWQEGTRLSHLPGVISETSSAVQTVLPSGVFSHPLQVALKQSVWSYKVFISFKIGPLKKIGSLHKPGSLHLGPCPRVCQSALGPWECASRHPLVGSKPEFTSTLVFMTTLCNKAVRVIVIPFIEEEMKVHSALITEGNNSCQSIFVLL